MSFYQKYIKLNEPRDFFSLRKDINLDEDEWFQEEINIKHCEFEDKLHAFSVIKMNSTFIDFIDYTYSNKGLGNYAIFSVFLIGCVVGFDIFFNKFDYSDKSYFQLIYFSAYPLIAFSLSLYFFWCYYGVENLHYTHFPIRINRLQKKIYFMNFEGIFKEYNLNQVTFYKSEIHKGSCHIGIVILDGNNKIVDRTIIGPDFLNYTYLDAYWNFICCYIEDGPKKLYPQCDDMIPIDDYSRVYFCNDIEDKKEDKKLAFFRVCLRSFFSFTIIFFCFLIVRYPIIFLGRIYGIKKSKIPVWPKWIEESNIIDKDDKFIVDASVNQYFKFQFIPQTFKVIKVLPDKYKK